jgi:hypothetical protein
VSPLSPTNYMPTITTEPTLPSKVRHQPAASPTSQVKSASRAGIHSRYFPEHYGSRKTVWKRYRHYAGDGSRDAVLCALPARADAEGLTGSEVLVDSRSSVPNSGQQSK